MEVWGLIPGKLQSDRKNRNCHKKWDPVEFLQIQGGKRAVTTAFIAHIWQRPRLYQSFCIVRTSVATCRVAAPELCLLPVLKSLSFHQPDILAEKHEHEMHGSLWIMMWSTSEWLTILGSNIYYQSANRLLWPLPIEFPLSEAMNSLFKFNTNVCLLLGVILLFLLGVAYLYSQTYKVKLGCKWKSTVSMPDLPPIFSFDIFLQLGVAYPFCHTLTHFDSCSMLKNWLLKVLTA